MLGSQWDSEEAYLYGAIIAILMIPSVAMKELLGYFLKNLRISKYAFFVTAVLITMSLIIIDHTHIDRESLGLLSILGLAQGVCSVLNYFFITYLAETRAISLVVRILGITYLVFYLIIILK